VVDLTLYLEIGSAFVSIVAGLLSFLFPRVGQATLDWRKRFNASQTALAVAAVLLAIGVGLGFYYWIYLDQGNAAQVAKVGALAGIGLLVATLVLLIYQIDTIRSFVRMLESEREQASRESAESRHDSEGLRTEVERVRSAIEERLPPSYIPEREDDG
jgi:hypothetical protein